MLKSTYGDKFGWSNLTEDELSKNWTKKKAEVMLTISQDLASGRLIGLEMPSHIQDIFDFMTGDQT